MEQILLRKETPVLPLEKMIQVWETQGEQDRFVLQNQRRPSQGTVASPPQCSHPDAGFKSHLSTGGIHVYPPNLDLSPIHQTPISDWNIMVSQTLCVHAELLTPPTCVPAVPPLKQG